MLAETRDRHDRDARGEWRCLARPQRFERGRWVGRGDDPIERDGARDLLFFRGPQLHRYRYDASAAAPDGVVGGDVARAGGQMKADAIAGPHTGVAQLARSALDRFVQI